MPVALIGFDADGLVAFANLDAERLLPELCACIGRDAGLPPWLNALRALSEEESVDVDIGNGLYRCRKRTIDDRCGRRGSLVSLIPIVDAVDERAPQVMVDRIAVNGSSHA